MEDSTTIHVKYTHRKNPGGLFPFVRNRIGIEKNLWEIYYIRLTDVFGEEIECIICAVASGADELGIRDFCPLCRNSFCEHYFNAKIVSFRAKRQQSPENQNSSPQSKYNKQCITVGLSSVIF